MRLKRYWNQNVFEKIAFPPDSAYSFLDTHIELNVCRDESVDPPIQAVRSRFFGAITFTFTWDGAIVYSDL